MQLLAAAVSGKNSQSRSSLGCGRQWEEERYLVTAGQAWQARTWDLKLVSMNGKEAGNVGKIRLDVLCKSYICLTTGFGPQINALLVVQDPSFSVVLCLDSGTSVGCYPWVEIEATYPQKLGICSPCQFFAMPQLIPTCHLGIGTTCPWPSSNSSEPAPHSATKSLEPRRRRVVTTTDIDCRPRSRCSIRLYEHCGSAHTPPLPR